MMNDGDIVFEHYPYVSYGPPESIVIRWSHHQQRFFVDTDRTSKQGSDMMRIATNMTQTANNYIKCGADWNKVIFSTKKNEGETCFYVKDHTPEKVSMTSNFKLIVMDTGELIIQNKDKIFIKVDATNEVAELLDKINQLVN